MAEVVAPVGESVPVSNVVSMNGYTLGRVSVDKVLGACEDYTEVFVIGVDADGKLHYHTSIGRGSKYTQTEIFYWMDRFKFKLMNGDFD